MSETSHISVMKEEVLKFFSERYPGSFLDMTFGGGGHTQAILDSHEKNSVTAVDCDPDAIKRAEALKRENPGRFTLRDGFFDEVELEENRYDGVLFDLGVSSFQLDETDRGFSFQTEAPADMRMNPRQGMPAWELLEKADSAQLERIVRDYAEEPRWKAVIRDLEKERSSGRLRTTLSLAHAISRHAQKSPRIHPATRVFMGLRIAVNDELGRIERALPRAFRALKSQGIMAIISFHSTEDRIVKVFFQSVSRPTERAQAELLVKKVERPGQEETLSNPRARSAKLRVLKKF
jgi:16S rRNA (cytosine1402-N4)-methyltransferase